MSDLKLSNAEARGWARAEAKADKETARETGVTMSKSAGIGVVFWMLLIGVILIGVFTYLPGQLDQRYAGGGQVITMVNPSGNNPAVDAQYSQINQANADANITNSRAYQNQSIVWMGWVFCLMGFGFMLVVFRWLTRSNKVIIKF